MKIKSVNDYYYVEMKKQGTSGIVVEVGDVSGSSKSVVVDRDKLKELLVELDLIGER